MENADQIEPSAIVVAIDDRRLPLGERPVSDARLRILFGDEETCRP